MIHDPSEDIRASENTIFESKLNSPTNDEDLELIFSGIIINIQWGIAAELIGVS